MVSKTQAATNASPFPRLEPILRRIKDGFLFCGRRFTKAHKKTLPLEKVEIALKNVSTFAQLELMVTASREHVSFLGWRYITVPGYRKTLHIDAFASKVMVMVKADPHFNEEQRSIGRRIATRVTGIYEDNDKRVKHKNLLTRIICAVRDFFRAVKELFGNIRAIFLNRPQQIGPRDKWMGHDFQGPHDGENECFEHYTAEQYLKAFGPLGSKQRPLRNNGGYPYRSNAERTYVI